jgi:hypothetical protein
MMEKIVGEIGYDAFVLGKSLEACQASDNEVDLRVRIHLCH